MGSEGGSGNWPPFSFCARIKDMSVVSRILYHRPDAFYILSGASPYLDVSRRRLSNITPTVTRVPVSPARGILETLNLAAATTITLHRAPDDEFTLMTQTKPLTASSTNLLSFYGIETEGLWQVGSMVYFGVRHVGGTFTTVSAEIDASAIHTVAGVAALDKITLYVDGSPVATKEITDTAPFDVDPTLTLGDTNPALYSFAAAWHKALGGQAIADIQQSAKPVPLRTSALGVIGAADLRLSAAAADLEQFVFSEGFPALVTSARVEGTAIRATYDASLLSVAGNVRFPLPFVSTTGGIRISWASSNGAVVKYSTDGTNFTAITNGHTFGTSGTITDQPLIEVSFPAGSASDMFLDSLTAERQVTGAFNASMSNGRPVTLSGSVSLANNSDFRNYASLPSTFGTNGTLTIGPETEDGTINTHALEFWYTPTAADLTGTKYIVDSGTSTVTVVSGKLNFAGFSTAYTNKSSAGSNGGPTMVAGVPYHIVLPYTTPANTNIVFGRSSSAVTGNISNIGLIFQAISAGDVTTLFDSQQDVPVTRPTTGEVVAATDTSVTNLNLIWSAGSQ